VPIIGQQYVTLADISSAYSKTTCGVHQGSVLKFSLYMSTIFKIAIMSLV